MANPIYMKEKKKKVENKGLGGANKQHQLLLDKHRVVGVRGQRMGNVKTSRKSTLTFYSISLKNFETGFCFAYIK